MACTYWYRHEYADGNTRSNSQSSLTVVLGSEQGWVLDGAVHCGMLVIWVKDVIGTTLREHASDQSELGTSQYGIGVEVGHGRVLSLDERPGAADLRSHRIAGVGLLGTGGT